MNIITGNILDITEGIICHQVNCKGVAGAGLAKQIRDKYPKWYMDYRKQYSKACLGSVDVFEAAPKLYIFSLYAQVNYGTDKRQTDYRAFESCLKKVKFCMNKGDTVYVPYGIGCNLAGGSWQVVSKIIDEVLPDAIVVRLG